jgi:hypothetical protein
LEKFRASVAGSNAAALSTVAMLPATASAAASTTRIVVLPHELQMSGM